MSGSHFTADLPFLRRFLVHPLRVASPVPSGPALAAAIAAQIEPDVRGSVLELGPGTGTVTQAIRNRGIAESDLIAIENDPDFIALLRQRFPQSRILEGDAFDFARLLRLEKIAGPFRAIVSGIPVLTQPIEIRRRFLREAMTLLKPSAPFIQFSYGRKPPLPVPPDVAVRHAQTIWRNIPPMHIWVYRREQEEVL
jgi:phosphatidylethanolamine/phosphatidyl-N-methylethanolamine N-methyltransferase